MIFELFITILPTFLILLLIYALIKILSNVKNIVILKAIFIGLLTVIPAIITMKSLGIFITIFVPVQLPLLFFQILSILNEETFKFLSIKYFRDKNHPVIFSVFVGGGFALCETLFLSLGNNQMALLRAITSLPLHMTTSILLSISIKKKRYFLYAILLHLLYNLFIN